MTHTDTHYMMTVHFGQPRTIPVRKSDACRFHGDPHLERWAAGLAVDEWSRAHPDVVAAHYRMFMERRNAVIRVTGHTEWKVGVIAAQDERHVQWGVVG